MAKQPSPQRTCEVCGQLYRVSKGRPKQRFCSNPCRHTALSWPLVGPKLCSRCNQPGEFAPDRRARDGLQSQCRECQRKGDLVRYHANPEPKISRGKRYWRSLPEDVRREKSRQRALYYTYGITLERFEEMLREQGGVCAICSRPPSGKTKRTSTLQVDHDHVTGEVRGLLCDPCNTALGRLGDSVAGIERVLRYLQTPHARRPEIATKEIPARDLDGS